jgi:hypothetical protein
VTKATALNPVPRGVFSLNWGRSLTASGFSYGQHCAWLKELLKLAARIFHIKFANQLVLGTAWCESGSPASS